MALVQVDGGEIEMVDCFMYLGSNLSRDRDVTLDVTSRIEKASKAFGALRGPISNNSNLSEQWFWQCYCMALKLGC